MQPQLYYGAMRTLTFFVVVFAVVVVASCARTVNVEQEKAALMAADAEWMQSARDLDKFVAHFTPDGTMAFHGLPILSGQNAIREAIGPMMKAPGFNLTREAGFIGFEIIDARHGAVRADAHVVFAAHFDGVLDVRHLKQINDQFGYNVGDDVLRTVADALLESSRSTDLVARYGGDEFAALLVEAGATGALMSGSGSSVFGIFATGHKARSAFRRFQQEKGLEAFLVHTLS